MPASQASEAMRVQRTSAPRCAQSAVRHAATPDVHVARYSMMRGSARDCQAISQ